MRFLIIAPADIRRGSIAKSIFDELKNFCSAVELIGVETFYDSSSYFQRKLYKLGYKKFENEYNRNLTARIESKYNEFQPDFILIFDGANIPLPVQNFLARYKIILWLWDSFKRFDALKHFVRIVSEIFCFEFEDVKILREEFSKRAHYLPLGVNEKIYYPAECERDIDISFIGWTSRERLEILEKVCKFACEKNLSVKIGGPFHDDKYFWKKILFRRRQKNLAHFLENRIFQPAEVAALYRRSKICLNINVSTHKSLNPRTFEICATNSFQLMNGGQNSHGLINLETDIATFDGSEDLLQKISFYLDNKELREQIALAGYNSVIQNCTIKKSVEKLFTLSEILRGLP